MIGSVPTQPGIESELTKFQNKLSQSLGTALTEEMNSWLIKTTKLIQNDPKLRNVLFTNLQFYNNSKKYDNLVDDWIHLFRLSLNDLLRVKGIVRYVDDEKDIQDLQNYLETGQGDEQIKEMDVTFISLLRR